MSQTGSVDAQPTDDGSVNLKLTKAEALVLFDWLHRIDAEASSSQLGQIDQAEQRVLWDFTACLERVLPELFRPDYGDVIAVAHLEVRDSAT